MPLENAITGVILAGGKSSRMQTEKGLVLFKGKDLIQHVIDALKLVTDLIIIISSNKAYKIFGYPCFPDVIKNKGALGGIYSGLHHSETEKNIIVGCDMPFLSQPLLEALIAHSDKHDAVISMHNGLEEPLCSLYNKSCIPHFETLIQEDRLKITDALEGLNCKKISFDAEPWFKGNEFANLNTPEDLKDN